MKKKIINILKISFLLTVRQIWTTGCNLYLLIQEPFLTVRRIKAKKDKSQAMLLGLIFVSPILIYGMARVVTDWWWYRKFLISVGPVFGLTFLIEMAVFSYVIYWIYQVISKNHFKDFKERI